MATEWKEIQTIHLARITEAPATVQIPFDTRILDGPMFVQLVPHDWSNGRFRGWKWSALIRSPDVIGPVEDQDTKRQAISVDDPQQSSGANAYYEDTDYPSQDPFFPISIKPASVEEPFSMVQVDAQQHLGTWQGIVDVYLVLVRVVSLPPDEPDIAVARAGMYSEEQSFELGLNAPTYGGMYQYDSGTTISISQVDTWYIVTGMTTGLVSGFTFQASKELKGLFAGAYRVGYSISFSMAAKDRHVEACVGVNGSYTAQTVAQSITPDNQGESCIAATGILRLEPEDLVQVLIRSRTDTSDITIKHATFTIERIDS